MNVNEIVLLNYLDSDLDEKSRLELEQQLETNADLREILAALQASNLPYQQAFSQQALPDMPTYIAAQVDKLANNNQQRKNEKPRTFSWSIAAGICLAFLTGSLVSMGIDKYSLNSQHYQLSKYAPKPLIDSMIQYQALYTRDTIKSVKQAQKDANAVLDQFNQDYKLKSSLADLSAFGYEFRRAQKLAHEDQTIIQLVYLAKQGRPLALCITKGEGSMLDMMHYPYAGMNTVIWTKAGVTYMLMGDRSEKELQFIYESMA